MPLCDELSLQSFVIVASYTSFDFNAKGVGQYFQVTYS